MSQSFYNNPRSVLFQNLELLFLGLIVLIFMIISSIIALKLINTYRKYKRKEHLLAGVTYFGMASVWADIPFNFIIILFFNEIPPMEAYFLVNGSLVIITNFLWIISILSLSKINKIVRKVISVVFGIITVIIEVLYLYLVFTDWTLLGHLINPLYAEYSPLLEILYAYHLIAFIIPGFWMSINSLKARGNELKLKSKLLILSFLIFTIGSIIQLFMMELILIFIIGQIILTISALLFYWAYVLPKWIVRLFLGEDKT